MKIFLKDFSKAFDKYKIILTMDRTSCHTSKSGKAFDNIRPLFLPPYSPELNLIEILWHHIREKGQFKNRTFNGMEEVEKNLAKQLKTINTETIKSLSQFPWIKSAI